MTKVQIKTENCYILLIKIPQQSFRCLGKYYNYMTFYFILSLRFRYQRKLK